MTHLCNARYLSDEMRARLGNPVTAVWDGKLPQTYPSPEDEWDSHPEWFVEYVDLCATRIREESGRPPSRSALIQAIRRYDRHKTGWLDFKAAKERAGPSPRDRPWYYRDDLPSWMQ